MHKKSVDIPRKGDVDEQATDNYRGEHHIENLLSRPSESHRNTQDKGNSMDTSEDRAIDLSSTAKQETPCNIRHGSNRDSQNDTTDSEH